MTIATTVLEQLGGNRFRMMTGSRDFVALESGLMFRVGSGARNGINKVRVVLTPADDYTVEFWRVRGTKATLVQSREGIYCDQLQEVFTNETGFYTRL